ncbi:MAG TPA: hypothetical protein PLV92_22025, partial [Pirellulaceae bacterium]|nr:hypothetical protein [Pirellulaceae bacterium]
LASSRFDRASGQTLQGVGAVAGGTLKLLSGATVSPATAATTGVLSTAGLILTAGATYSAQVNGSATAGADYDQVQVVGAVDLGGATLSIGGGITSVLNDIVLVNNDGTDPVVGTFAGLPEGSPLTINGVNVYISYVGGTGNDVVLNVPGIVLGTNGDDMMVVEPLAGGAVRYTLNNDAPKTIPAGVGTFTFNGIGGDDTMIVNLNANALIGGGYVFNGGSQASPLSGGGNTSHGDVLKIVGTGLETANFLGDGVANASLDNDGAVVIPGLGTIQYTGLEPVDLQGFSTVNVQFANGPEALTIAGGVDAATNTNPALVVSGTSGGVAFEAVHLRGNTNVVIDTTTGGSDGADTVTITGGSIAHGNTNLTIATGAGADSVSVTGSLVVAGALSISAETIGVTGSLATGAGTLALSARDDVSIGAAGTLTSVSGNILVTADSDSSGAAGGAITMASSGSIDAGSGAVTLTASENIAVGVVVTTNGSATAAVAITSNYGAVTDANAGESNVTAGSGGATMTAASG